MPSRAHAVAGALLVALAAPASAQAGPTIEPLRPCYVTAGTAKKPRGEPVMIRAAGFNPNSKVDLTVNGEYIKGSQGLQVGDAGLLTLDEFPAPFVKRGSSDFTVMLTERDNPANTATATAKSTRLDVEIRPRIARPPQQISFQGSGFTGEGPVYAHYTRKGRQVARVRMARRTGECGTWSARRPQFPMKAPTPGRWVVQFDQSRKYVNGRRGKFKGVQVLVEFTVTLEPR